MKKLKNFAKQKIKRTFLLLLCLCLGLSEYPITIVKANNENSKMYNSEKNYTEERSSEEEYFLPIIVQEDCVTQGQDKVDYIVEDEEILVNTESLTCDTIDEEIVQEMEMVEVGEEQYVALEDVAAECNMEVVEEKDRIVYVKPFQTKSLIVEADGRLPNVDATKIVKEDDTYILEFATEEDTKEAYEVLEDSKRVSSVTGENVYHTFALTEDHLSWGADYINSPHTISYAETMKDKEEVVVAIIDTGVDSDHPYLEGRIHQDSSEVDFSSYEDGNGHGTHVAGIVAANTPSNVSIMVVRGLNSEGYASDRTLANAIYYAVNAGADIINMSWGGYEFWTEDVLKRAVKTAFDAGVTLVAAAGNESDDAGYFYPASSAYCITVSASKQDGSKAAFSNYGSCVDVSAPGSQILSTYLNGGYAVLSGTSMSAPFVAAACAMEQTFYGKKTPTKMRSAIISHVTPFTDGCSNRGKGIINFTPYMEKVESVMPVQFSHESGYYEEELEITLSCETTDALIYYTMEEINSREGANPRPDNGILYTGPIKIKENTVIRAAAYREDLFPSRVTQETYRYDDCDTEDAYVVDSEGTLTAYLGYQTVLEVPQEIRGITVTAIGQDVFRESLITEIILPDTVTEIGDNAFREAYSLKKIQARGVLSLGDRSFYKAENLKTVLMDSVQTMGVYCFANIYELTELEMNQLTAISEGAFSGTWIRTLSANKVESVGKRAFWECYDLYQVSLNSVRRIEEEAFYDSTLVKIDMPVVEYIGEKAFYWNDTLREIYSEKLEKIEENAFAYCDRLRKVDLPNVRHIASTAFNKCELSYLNIPKVEWANLGGCKLKATITELNLPEAIYVQCGTAAGVERIYLPKCIQLYGFSHSSQLKEVYAPNAIKVSAFSNCEQLKEVCFPLADECNISNFAGEMIYAPKAKEVSLKTFSKLRYGIYSECTEATIYLNHDWDTYLYFPQLQQLDVEKNSNGDNIEIVAGHINVPNLRRLSFRGQYFPIALTEFVLHIIENGSYKDLDELAEPLQLYSNNKNVSFSSGATNYEVVKPPVLKEDLPDEFEVTNEHFMLEVTAYCAVAKYEWYYSKDGKTFTKLDGNARDRIIPGESGYYYCRITDKERRNYVETTKCKVTVSVPMKKLQFNLKYTAVCFGQEVFPEVENETIWVPVDTKVRVLYNGDFNKIYLDNNKVIETDGIEFSFEATKDWTICPEKKKSIRSAEIEIQGAYALKENSEYKLIMQVIYDGEILKESEHYEIYAVVKTKNDSTGSGSVAVSYIVKGIGEYAGAVGGVENVAIPHLDKCEIRPIEDTIYTGKTLTPEVEILYQGEILPNNLYTCEYKNNIEPGTATVTIIGDGNLQGTKEVTFEIYIPMSDVTLTYEKETVYKNTSYKILPTYNVSHEEYKVTYNAEYFDCKEVGMARARLTGTGVFRGTLEFEYEIVPQLLEEYYKHVTYPRVNEYIHMYTGLPIEAPYTAYNLTDDIHYKVSYENNVEPGIATITMTGIGNFTGTITMEFEIVPIEEGSFADKIHILKKETYTYTGAPVEVEIYADGLVEGTDYVVSYEDNVNPGIATVKVTGIGDYKGTRGTTFEIKEAPLKQDFFRMEKESYCGTIQTIKPRVICEKYKEGKDYTVQFSQDKHTKKGIATITGIGNYEGKVVLTYNIIPYEKTVVTGVVSSSNHHKQIKIVWDKIDEATGYQVYDTEKKKVIKTVTSNNAVITKLKRNSLHRYQVRPYYKGNGKTYYGRYSNITICKTAPKPTYISAHSKKGKEYRIYCGDFGIVKGVAGIELVISNSKTFKGSVVIRKNIKTKNTKTILRNLKKGTYYVKARTYNTYVDENGKKMKSYSKYCSTHRFKLKRDL